MPTARAIALAAGVAFSSILGATEAPPVTTPEQNAVVWHRQNHHTPSRSDRYEDVRRLIDHSRREGDLRALGRAQALLDSTSAPHTVEATVLRAIIAQRNHDFEGATTLILEALAQQPMHAQANFTLYNVALVRGDTALARSACGQLRTLGFALIERSCHYNLMALSGDAGAAQLAFKGLQNALGNNTRAQPVERAWASATLAELAASINHPDTERFYLQALSLSHDDHYSAAALADWYLGHGKATQALAVLARRPHTDRLDLLRLIAYRQLNSPAATELQQQLAQRFRAASERDSALHLYEQARFMLDVADQPKVALELAKRNFKQQKERADRALLERAKRAMAVTQ